MYEEWEKQFLNYMQPHAADFFPGKKILDAGCGNGRFAYYAAKYGAEVWAIDLGPAVEVAQHNTQSRNVHVVQADLHNPPFALESFDFIYSIGVLHHLPNPEAAFQNLLRFLKPGGVVQIYLYWKPEQRPIKSAMLSGDNGGAPADDTTATQCGLCACVSDGDGGFHVFCVALSHPATILAVQSRSGRHSAEAVRKFAVQSLRKRSARSLLGADRESLHARRTCKTGWPARRWKHPAWVRISDGSRPATKSTKKISHKKAQKAQKREGKKPR